VQIGATTAITEGKTINVAGGQIQPVDAQQQCLIFLKFVILF
jgi:hypothetical protein